MVFEYYIDMDLYSFLLENVFKLLGLILLDIFEYDLLLDFLL